VLALARFSLIRSKSAALTLFFKLYIGHDKAAGADEVARQQQFEPAYSGEIRRQHRAHRQEPQVHQSTGDKNLERGYSRRERFEDRKLRRPGIDPCGYQNNFIEPKAVRLRGSPPCDGRRDKSDPYGNRRLHPLAKTRRENHLFRIADASVLNVWNNWND
jgi:hypothetical protein